MSANTDMVHPRKFLDVRNHGFVRVAVAIPKTFVGDVWKNASSHCRTINDACLNHGAYYVLCPELGLTSYSCGDLFHSQLLQKTALEGLKWLMESTKDLKVVVTVGMPLVNGNQLFNTAVTFHAGEILAVAPKSYPPEYREFYEGRYFARSVEAHDNMIRIFGKYIPFGNDVLIASREYPHFVLHTEVCEDIWVPIPPSAHAALAGATVLANLSASNITIGKSEYREMLVLNSSAKNQAVQMYSAAGFGESTTDLAWDGDGLIAERGILLARSERFKLESQIVVSDVDLETLVQERLCQSSFGQNALDERRNFRTVEFDSTRVAFNPPNFVDTPILKLNIHCRFKRHIDPHPFVPSDPAKLGIRCHETFMIQATSLAKRLLHLPEKLRNVAIGVSGGTDSTHALNISAYTMDMIGLPRENIMAVTMPGFGTTDRTKSNACKLMKALRVTAMEIPITPLVVELFKSIGRPLDENSLLFENSQAWARKLIELSLSCDVGINLGTGDLSELMLGWTTMFGDHASHYGVNAGVPKTLMSKHLIKWAAENIFADNPEAQATLLDILATPISPELLRPDGNQIVQKTEEIIGPYELHDFFGQYFVRFGMSPFKIARLAYHAFGDKYSIAEIKKWLRVFLIRFFKTQVKRNCLPDGVKTGATSVSPRGDWRMPSDADPMIWLDDLDKVPDEIVE